MKITKLLEDVENIIRKNDELSVLKGENFNIFQIFELESDENKMHSRFISTLLNPKGSHGRVSVFLKLFLETLDIPFYFKNYDSVKLTVEYSIGNIKIDGNASTGGRIDIYIWDNQKSLSIENKIFAADQEKQIIRYCNFQKNSNKVMYLTLFGNEPEYFSSGELKSNNSNYFEHPDFYCISYSETILSWLEKCLKEASDYPVVRETVKQYIVNVKRLTTQLTDQRMEEEIFKHMVENFEAAKFIANNFENAKKRIIDEFLEDIKMRLYHVSNEDLGDGWIITKGSIDDKYCKLQIKKNDWVSDSGVCFQAEPYFWKSVTIIGFPCIRESKMRPHLKNSLGEKAFEELITKYQRETPKWLFFRHTFNFSNDHQFEQLLSTETKNDLVYRVVDEMFELAKLLDKHLVK